jgi:plastocyanin
MTRLPAARLPAAKVSAALGAFVLALLLAACSGGGAAASVSPPPGVDTTITAKGNAFQNPTVTLPADKPTKVFFKNLDSQPHNIAIYKDSSASQKIFVGETINDSAKVYDVPAIPAGDYFFRCDVHPEMTGKVVVSGT